MKRIFLSAICTLLALLVANTYLAAQQDSPSSEKIIVIQKQKSEDGTVTIKKKRFNKGEPYEYYMKELGIENNPQHDIEVTLLGEEADENAAPGETLIYIRGAGQHEIKINGQGDFEQELEEVKVDIRREMQGMHRNHHFNFDHEGGNWKVVDVKKTFLGVYPESGDEGVYLSGIVEGSGASNAGLKEGDILTSINGNGIRTTSDLNGELKKYKGGDVVSVAYLRNGQSAEAKVTLTEKASKKYVNERNPCKVFLGVYVGDYGNGEEGIGVNGLVEGEGWPAEKAGLRKGDRILALDGMPIYDHATLVSERDKHQPGEFFTITYLREGVFKDVEAQFKACPKEEETQQEEAVNEKITEQTTQPIELIDNELQLEELAAYPNPTYGYLNVSFRGAAVPTTVTITDISGKVVHNESIQNFDGYYNKMLNISAGSPGNMVLSIRQEGKVISTPVVLLNRA
jgi:membrane-associated protease RseP (regulator of RpoE activity)